MEGKVDGKQGRGRAKGTAMAAWTRFRRVPSVQKIRTALNPRPCNALSSVRVTCVHDLDVAQNPQMSDSRSHQVCRDADEPSSTCQQSETSSQGRRRIAEGS